MNEAPPADPPLVHSRCLRSCPAALVPLLSGRGGGWVLVRGGGGWGGDASIGSFPSAFPLGGADACTPRQSVKLLYGPSICTRLVQINLRRSQVRRPFPIPGSGTLRVVRGALAGQAWV